MRSAPSLAVAVRRTRLPLLVTAAIAILSPCRAQADAFPDTIFFDGFEACGLRCAQVQCPDPGVTTSVSGTVFAPNGTLPLPNVEVYVPNAAVGALTSGPDGGRCDVAPLGHPIVATLTDANGNFTLKNMPVGNNIPLVIIAGKWRRQITVGSVPQCTDTLLAADDTRLPRTHLEGDIPLTAVVTGNADSLECLMRKTGVADTEFGSNAGSARIQLFAGNGASSVDGGIALANATTLWASSASLSAYDQVMLACEGAQQTATQTQVAVNAMKTYADAGGRVYLAHWQNLWIAGQNGGGITGAWPAVATWNFNSANLDTFLTASVNSTFPQGATMTDWLYGTGASATWGSITLDHPRQTAITIDESLARKWITQTASLNMPGVPYFSFTTPIEVTPAAQQGRIVFVDLHGTSADSSTAGTSFPSSGCHSGVGTTTAQEKALLYATFDLQRCVGSTRE